ncbi:MAG TPA: recombination mediator RecR [Coxiellaceae bacterium]|nr:recombination mediator RecR [Coxiellaceae bacterium]
MFSPLIKQLIDAFRCLPGVGPKSAQRMAFQLLTESGKNKGQHLAKTLQEALEKVGYCQSCRIYTEQTLCELCENSRRNHHILCVVESPADVTAIEQSNTYRGLYFVLQGHLSPLDGIGPNDIGINELLTRLESSEVEELILATNPTVEGEATAHYIVSRLTNKKIKCSRIAHGVPIGGELEYLDGGTLSHALLSRITIETNS